MPEQPPPIICSGCTQQKQTQAEADACATADLIRRIEEEARRRKP